MTKPPHPKGIQTSGGQSVPTLSSPAIWSWPAIWPVLLALTGVSALFLWLAIGAPAVALAYVAGLLLLGGAAAWRFPSQPAEPVAEAAPIFDWSVTLAALDQGDGAIAITHQSGQMICANHRYTQWFDHGVTPQSVLKAEGQDTQLHCILSEVHQHGASVIDYITIREKHLRCVVTEAGQAERFLIWHFHTSNKPDFTQLAQPQIIEALHGAIGRILSREGMMAVLVDANGTILGASTDVAEQAADDPGAVLVGRKFSSLLQQDSSGRYWWANDRDNSGLLTLYRLRLQDPDQDTNGPCASLMLIADANVGIGGGLSASLAPSHIAALLDHLPVGLAIANRKGQLMFANPAFMRAAGRDSKPVPDEATDLVINEDRAALSDALYRHATGPGARSAIAVRLAKTDKTAEDEPVTLSLSSVRGLGEAAVLLGLVDSAEEKRLKLQIAQATKMQAVGQLAGGVAHDFNNVLTAILGICDLMLLRHLPGDSDYDDIQQILANSNRAASLTRQLLAFSRQQTLRPQVVQLPDVISDVSQMLKRLLGESVEITITHDRNLEPVRADPSQLEQILMNLVVNGRDAIQTRGDGRGRITVSTRRITASDARALRSDILPIGEYSAFVVEDDGEGIPPEHLGKIFEPFFTTKEQGKGTGLGLSTVYGIVKQSGGYIFADSAPGEGTRFTVYLPVYRGPVAEEAEPADNPPEVSWNAGGRILLVEDEDLVRIVGERALTRSGYDVVTANDGENGLEHVQQSGAFDLVISDVVMPVMDGPAMAREIRKIDHEIPVLFVSGYAEEQLRREIDLPNVYFLPKPFSVKTISDKVSTILKSHNKSLKPHNK